VIALIGQRDDADTTRSVVVCCGRAGMRVPKIDLCPACIDFAVEGINVLLNEILNGGIVGGCGALCSKLGSKAAQDFCDAACDAIGA
jgi:hypothetical protein